jgi:hypothetical protein
MSMSDKKRPPRPPAKEKPYSRPVGAELPGAIQVDDYSVTGDHPVFMSDPSLPPGGPSPGPLPQEVPKPPVPGGNPSSGGQQQQNKPSR